MGLEAWKHGFIRETRTGKVFVLVATANGKRYRKTLVGIPDEIEAEKQWVLFKRSPETFQTGLDLDRADREAEEAKAASACVLNEAEIAIFEKAVKYHPDYKLGLTRYLADWAKVFKGTDIKDIPIKTVDAALTRWAKKKPKNIKRNHDGAKAYRIKALKTWVKFLKSAEGGRRLTEAQDPFRSLKVPQPGPKQEKAYSIEYLNDVYGRIKVWSHPEGKRFKRVPDADAVQAVRDVVLLAAATGMHLSEIERLAACKGKVRALGPEYGPEFAGTIKFPHKTAVDHIVSLDSRALAAAQRLQARKSTPSRSFIRAVLKKARADASEPVLNVGWLRHSFITNSAGFGRLLMPLNQGVDLETIAQIVGHKSIKMTSSVYNTNQVPPRISIGSLVLINTDDVTT